MKLLDPGSFRALVLSLLPAFPEAALDRLYESAEERLYEHNEFLLTEGLTCPGVFFLIWADRARLSFQRDTTKCLDVRELTGPAVLGLRETLLDGYATVSVRAIDAVRTAFISRSSFLRLLQEFPQAAIACAASVSDELQTAYQHLSELRTSTRI